MTLLLSIDFFYRSDLTKSGKIVQMLTENCYFIAILLQYFLQLYTYKLIHYINFYVEKCYLGFIV